MNVGCPTCGATVEFRYDDSLVRVCGSCRSAVLRTDRGIETLGRVADLAPIDSPLRLFAEGRYGEHGFLLVGMAQIRHGAGGVWQEWYAKLDGGRWAWLAEAQGRYYITFERADIAPPPLASLAPGAQVPIDGRPFTVGEIGTGAYVSATGEIPYRLDPRATFRFADLADGQGGFATIDDGDGSEPPALYAGHQVTLESLRLSGGEAPAVSGAPGAPGTSGAPRQGARLPCPNCGGSLALAAPDQALRVACPYCNHLVGVASGQLSVIAKLARKARPRIPLGTKGTFADGELTVIGYLQRSALVDGVWFPFEEYLLYAPGVGFRWLVCSDGHWSYVQPIAPGAVELAPVRYEGVAFETFSRATLRVDEVLGELYWLVQEGERVFGEDYIAPPAMLSCETSDTEQTWSLGTYLTARQVEAALGRADLDLGTPVGVGAIQPYPLHGAGRVAAVLLVALCVAGIAQAGASRDVLVHATTVVLPPGRFEPAGVTPRGTPGALDGADPATPVTSAELPSNIQFTEKFALAARDNIQIDLTASLDNNWAYVAVDLVNDRTGALVSYDANLERYSGVTDGEAWSEGDGTDRQVLGPMPAGEYVLRVESLHGDPGPVGLRIEVRQDVFRARYWLIALAFLALPFGIVAVHAANFRKRRWENSQILPSTESTSHHAGSAGGDDDD